MTANEQEAAILAAVEAAEYMPRVVSEWGTFLAEYDRPTKYVIPDLVPEGAQVTIYAPGGIGKSLLALDLAIKVAAGRNVLGEQQEPLKVLYLDYENGDGTTADRLREFGVIPTATDGIDGRLFYCPFPDMPLDTRTGAATLARLVETYEPGLVIIDSLNQATEGREDASDTFRDFAAYTSAYLREHGIASIRLDNTGKDTARGQRGSSKKRDEVDLSWSLSVNENGDRTLVTLKNDKDRFGTAPKVIRLERAEDPYLSHNIDENATISDKATKVIQDLKRLEVPTDVTVREARVALRNDECRHRSDSITEAVRWRKRWEQIRGTRRGTQETRIGEHVGEHNAPLR